MLLLIVDMPEPLSSKPPGKPAGTQFAVAAGVGDL
jgi:hypothetical protein